MKIKLNGKNRELVKEAAVEDVVNRFCGNPKGVVIELNSEIISKNCWKKKKLRDGDVLEIISFMGGG